MKFVPRAIKENVNISKTHPLKELFILLSAVLGILLVIYLVLGFALDRIVQNMPLKVEKNLGDFFSKRFSFKRTPSPAETKMQELVDDLAQNMPGENLEFTVRIVESSDVNAMALPGGHIVVYSSLIKEAESENELAMVLAHELGHFAHRDHLRGLGRGLVVVVISSIFFGFDSPATDFMKSALLTTDLKFSRQQEEAADRFALDLLYKKYGHVGGATDFFKRIKKREKMPRFFTFFSTHPYSLDRVSLLRKEMKGKGYEIKDRTPLDSIYMKKFNKYEK